ncbi:MAG: hypothetical protein AAF753_02165 [Pseudomonadota bacterium]
MLKPVLAAALCLTGAAPALAIADDPELVRLPGANTAKDTRPGEAPVRFVPGGGLLLSFDMDRDGRITAQEREAGVLRAFAQADGNGDGVLGALEQQAWAASLPTRDESLANPVRFDPNLDRLVSAEEFGSVIDAMAAPYADASSGTIEITSLKEDPAVRRDTAQRPDAARRGPPNTNF